MITKKFQNNDQNFHCKLCNYYGKRLSQFQRHLQTKKHLKQEMITNGNKKVPNKIFSCECGKIYKYNSGYSRHKKTCEFIDKKNKNDSTELANNDSIVKMLHDAMKQNNLLQEKIIAMQNDHDKAIKEQNKVIQDIIPKIGNQTNSNNNIINVQMFLNEKCGEAMSIQNFANQLFITMDDLNNNKKDCISNVVLKNLKPLSITQRPFHCTDIKNKEWFVKDEKEGWEEDNGEKLIKTAEYGIQKKWCNAFENMYPDWMKDANLRDKYIEIAGSTTSELPEKIKLKLLKELATEVPLTKSVMC
tara:strand:+ start:434 stop:1339 length:906 start_codon:yes stop_codon:yes gene_type:complete